MICKKYSFLIVCLLIGSSLFAQQKMTLQQCIETGIANNFNVAQRQVAAEAASLSYKQARLNQLPDLNADGGHSFNQGRSIDPFTNTPVTQSFNASNYSVSSGVTLFSGLVNQNTIRRQNLAWQASKMELQQEKDNLTINIILGYLQVLSLTEQLSLVKQQMVLSGKQVERLTTLDNEGSIKPSELYDLKGQYANDQLSIVNTENLLETAKLALCRLMNIPYQKEMELEKMTADNFLEQYDNTADQVYQSALTELALVKAANLRVQSAQKNIKVVQGGLWPTLRFGGSVSTNYSSVATQNNFLGSVDKQSTDYVTINGNQVPVFKKQDNFSQSNIPYTDQLNNNLYTSVGFTLRVPIFNSLRQRNLVKLARFDLKASEITADATRQQLRQDIDQALINRSSAVDRFRYAKEQVSAYDASFKAAEIRFTEGVGNSIDYLTAKNNLDRANINLVNARYDYVLRGKILDFYQGRKLW